VPVDPEARAKAVAAVKDAADAVYEAFQLGYRAGFAQGKVAGLSEGLEMVRDWGAARKAEPAGVDQGSAR
jgi:hypothetical protein